MSEEKVKSVDKATIELLGKAEKDNVSTAFFRADTMKPCPIGVEESSLQDMRDGAVQDAKVQEGRRRRDKEDGRVRRNDRYGRRKEFRTEGRGRNRFALGPRP